MSQRARDCIVSPQLPLTLVDFLPGAGAVRSPCQSGRPPPLECLQSWRQLPLAGSLQRCSVDGKKRLEVWKIPHEIYHQEYVCLFLPFPVCITSVRAIGPPIHKIFSSRRPQMLQYVAATNCFSIQLNIQNNN